MTISGLWSRLFGWGEVYLKRRVLRIMLLGFFSGLPLALTASTLFTWLAEAGVDKTTIGLFAAIAIPYSLKFLWSPVMDGVAIPVLTRYMGRRRSWLLLLQLLLTFSIAAFAFADPNVPATFALMALGVAFFSASQDIVIDAYRVESLPTQEQGSAAAMYTFGYRIAMLISGAGALWLSDQVSWQSTYLAMAGLMAAGLLTTLLMPEPDISAEIKPAHSVSQWIHQSVIAPFADFMNRKGWVAILVFVVLYKLADAFLGIMFNPFLLSLGFSKTQIAEIVKLYGLAATLVGGFIGGSLVVRWGMMRTLLSTSVLHMLTNLLLVVQADLGAHEGFLTLCVVTENMTAGMGSAAFIAYLSSLCRAQFTATQYALLSSLASVARTTLSTAAGKTAELLGWQGFFLFSSLLAIPSIVMIVILRRRLSN